MAPAHFIPRPLRGWGRKTYASFSKEPEVRTACIFVHGFNGSPALTWLNFPELSERGVELRKADIYYYGYDSLYQQVNVSAVHFEEFLTVLMSNPGAVTPSFIDKYRRDESFLDRPHYQQVLIVGHSLGAVIIRRALLFAHRRGVAWLPVVKTMFFAPAHLGARIIALLKDSLFEKPLVVLAVAVRYKIPTIDDLKQNSPTLAGILNETITLQAQDPSPEHFTIAKSVIIAGDEKIVYTDPFCKDPPPHPIDDKQHSNVCKPKEYFMEPVQLVETVLDELKGSR